MAQADPDARQLEAGWSALERNDLPGAERIARRLLEKDPLETQALHLLGASLLYQERFQEALAPLDEAHRAAPRKGSGHRLGYCHLALGDFEAAVRELEREVRLYPQLSNARNALGVALIRLSRREQALATFLEAAQLDPASPEANSNAGSLLADLGRVNEALPYLQAAVRASPGLADAHFNLGLAYQRLKQHAQAADSLQLALDIAPRMPYALGHLVWNRIAQCRWEGTAERIASLREQVRRDGVPAMPFEFVAVCDDPAEQRRCAELHVARSLGARPAPLWRGERYRHDRIRLAYLSADFCEHATAYLMAGLFERHDRSRFETIALSYGPDDASPMRKRLARAFERFVDVRTLSDAAAARVLRDLEIDVAVDLKGHTADARPGILAHRPAPVQVSYLGFPGTTGTDFIDYVLADRHVLPESERAAWSEKVAYLPECYQANDAGRVIADRTPSRAEAGLPSQGFVFCSFNNNYKITPQVFDAWMRLLRQVPASVLWVLEDNTVARRNLQREAEARGVEPQRLVFAPRVPHAEHLARHRLADLFLDTLPYNAHTSASDALWAGLPLLTCTGNTFAGRVAASLLHAIGLPELVTHSLAEYEALALQLAANPGRLSALRARLAANQMTAPLFDTDRFRRHLEAAYLRMLESHWAP
ncbi:MAG TPA: tetratricopeptide repeat protein [Burkholderiales bacterium]|nr:tetratricopeptide repeat protein [Burkholderiales bacterium]